ncbi:MAG: hypothetical protein EBQ94_04125 [Flavobacteriales bacterium]|nr:hypothetical protein [Crocinitomicaceae bacterium]NBX79561.1 hypothetical protein [Flavobacteriales bacterium]NCA20855.1 hypothetical protein [Crocinitomicaceae bacterium]
MKTNNHFSKVEILKIYAACWNSLDSSKLNNLLHDAVEYNSMWVLETIVGKQAFIDYFSGKLNTLKLQKANTQIEAKLFMSSTWTSHVLMPCLVITQQFQNGTTQKVSLFIEVENGLITHINLCDMNFVFFEFNLN